MIKFKKIASIALLRMKYSMLINPIIFIGKRSVLQNSPRLRSKPKKQEFDMYEYHYIFYDLNIDNRPRIDNKAFIEESNYLMNRLISAFNELKKDDSRVHFIDLSDYS